MSPFRARANYQSLPLSINFPLFLVVRYCWNGWFAHQAALLQEGNRPFYRKKTKVAGVTFAFFAGVLSNGSCLN